MSKCGESLRTASNGKSRGFCKKPKGHQGACGGLRCLDCAVRLMKNNKSLNKNYLHICKSCLCLRYRKYNRAQRQRLGIKPQNCGIANTRHTFFFCGCFGILPEIGNSNKFAVHASKIRHQWTCRVSKILAASQGAAEKHKHEPIDIETPHHIIRDMMEKACVHCGDELDWNTLGMGKTPHLDHDHETGKINGFSHSKCNPWAMRNEIRRLKDEIRKLKEKLGE